jgi:NAD+ synthase (glutamine-hydrolysing)
MTEPPLRHIEKAVASGGPGTGACGQGKMTFQSIYRHGFARVAACVTRSHIADPIANADAILAAARQCSDQATAIAVFPELGLSGYAIEDLLMQDALLDAVERQLARLVAASADLATVLVVGAPLRHGARIYNCAAVIHRGRLLGVVPKTYLPTYREFYEARHFASGRHCTNSEIAIGGSCSASRFARTCGSR